MNQKRPGTDRDPKSKTTGSKPKKKKAKKTGGY